jgi:hypothetical protein
MRVVRKSAQRGFVLPERGYPVRQPPGLASSAETAFVLGVAREESGFDPHVRSSAGAVGVMQLMPTTAHILARKLGYSYELGRLEDADFNMTLGAAYLGQLVDQFGGSYVMAAAAYNAGPGRPTEWTSFCGDPRSTSQDPADYIECIPFSETRNYVMRVLEATEDYRAGAAVVFDRPREAQVVMEHIDFADPLRGPYFRRNAEYLAEVNPLTDCLDGSGPADSGRVDGDNPIQVMFSGPCPEMRAARKLLESTGFASEFTTELTEYPTRNFSILDVLQHGVSKGVALAEWTRRRGVAPAEVMAIGDNWNDRDMLEFAGVAVVMGNSVPELKSLGWPVTLSNDDSGVAEAIRTYAFGEKLKIRL